jgi:D-lactate dehydrogenase (cytochrome)
MSTSTIILQDAIPWESCQAIDRACREHRGAGSLPLLASFLEEQGLARLECDQDIVAGYTRDSSNLPGAALALARPKTAGECAAVLRACFSAGVPCTVSAGRSNLTGSATPEGGVVMSLEGMRAAVRVDQEKRTVWTQPGVILEDLRRTVLQESKGSLIFPVDPTSRSDAMVGGAVASNASGFSPGEAGAMRCWVAALDVLLPGGLMVSAQRGQYLSEGGFFLLSHRGTETMLPVPRYARPSVKNASGPFSSPGGIMDFVDLMVGSEGIFGVVTSCTLGLAPAPEDCLDIFLSLPDEDEAISFFFYLRGFLAGDFCNISAFEYFGKNSRRYMDHEVRFFSPDHQAGIYLQVALRARTVEEGAEEWFNILLRSPCNIDGDDIRILASERDRAVFLEARHSLPANSLEVVKARGTYTIMTDAVVPPGHFREFMEYANGLIVSEGLDYLSFGHLGDCHIHFMILPEKDELERGARVYDLIIGKSAALGGVYSGEHGTGKRKRHDFLQCYGMGGAGEVRRTKAALDPRFLLNRGNVVEPPMG